MARLVEFATAEGSDAVVVVEVADSEPKGPVRVGRGGEMVEKAKVSLAQALEGVRPLAEGLLGQLRGLAQAPEGVSLEFGIKLNAEVGMVLASAASEGHCKVTVSWTRGG